MTNESLENIMQTTPFYSLGQRLKSTRESLGIALHEAALQLRLNEKVLMMLEADTCPSHLPTMFVKGYIRAYAKLLQLPEEEIQSALTAVNTTPTHPATEPNPHSPKASTPVTSSHFSMQFFTYLIVFTLFGLVAAWWYSHSSTAPAPNNDTLSQNPLFLAEQSPLLNKHTASFPAESLAGSTVAEVNLPEAAEAHHNPEQANAANPTPHSENSKQAAAAPTHSSTSQVSEEENESAESTEEEVETE